MEAGGDPDRFWRLTPAQIVREHAAMAKRRDNDMQRLAWLAWHTAALQRVKTMPRFSDFNRSTQPRKAQSPEEMKAFLKLALGGRKRHG